MEPKKATCKMCGREFPYYAIADSSMDVGKEPAHCGRKECVANWEYQQRTRNLQTGETLPAEKIRKI